MYVAWAWKLATIRCCFVSNVISFAFETLCPYPHGKRDDSTAAFSLHIVQLTKSVSVLSSLPLCPFGYLSARVRVAGVNTGRFIAVLNYGVSDAVVNGTQSRSPPKPQNFHYVK